MSGWIKLEKDRRDDPRVLLMAKQLRNAGVTHERFTHSAHVTLVLGCLDQLWCYADTHVRDDDALDIGVDDIDELVGIKGFASLMPSDWLEVIDAEHVKLPGFHAHNGTESRRKALTQKRVERHRDSVTQERYGVKRNGVTSALPDLDQTKTYTRPDQEKRTTTVAPLPKQKYANEFAIFKTIYPKRSGSQPWNKAYKSLAARLDGGVVWGEIESGALRYAEWCRQTGKVGTEFVMQAGRFLGPELQFLLAWDLPMTKADSRLSGNLDAAAEFMERTNAQ